MGRMEALYVCRNSLKEKKVKNLGWVLNYARKNIIKSIIVNQHNGTYGVRGNFLDVFKCFKCNKHKSGLELKESTSYPYAEPPRIEYTCKDCFQFDCEPIELTPEQVINAKRLLMDSPPNHEI